MVSHRIFEQDYHEMNYTLGLDDSLTCEHVFGTDAPYWVDDGSYGVIVQNTTVEEVINTTTSNEMTELELNTTVEDPEPLNLQPLIGTWGLDDLLIHLNSFDSGLIGTGNPAFFERAYGLKMSHDSTFTVKVLNETAMQFGGTFAADWTHNSEGEATFILVRE